MPDREDHRARIAKARDQHPRSSQEEEGAVRNEIEKVADEPKNRSITKMNVKEMNILFGY